MRITGMNETSMIAGDFSAPDPDPRRQAVG